MLGNIKITPDITYEERKKSFSVTNYLSICTFQRMGKNRKTISFI